MRTVIFKNSSFFAEPDLSFNPQRFTYEYYKVKNHQYWFHSDVNHE